MKKFNPLAVICSVIIMICACVCSVTNVAALTGQEILSDLAAVGTSIGINVGDFVSTTEAVTETQTSSPEAEEQLGGFLSDLGVNLDVLAVADMVNYLKSGKTFADWVYNEYGDSVEIPESVRNMSTKDVILYLLGVALYPSESVATTKDGYVFVPSEVNTQEETTTRRFVNETQSKTNIVIMPPQETAEEYKTGDVNGDGKITASDARLILRAAAGVEVLAGAVAGAADVNGDTVVTSKDARSVLRYAAGVTNSF